jgi:serine/threonine protein kinase
MPMSQVEAHTFTERRSCVRLATAPPDLPGPGDVIAGKYQLVRTIGEGGMGIVYEVTHLYLRQRLAMKVVRPDALGFDDVVARFEREARAAAQLNSIHTARVLDVDLLPSGLPYMVLEFLDGRDLAAELETTAPMAVQDAVDIALQVADAMAQAHAQGIVHRDLKPSNLFVCRAVDGARRVVKVLDFGISRIEEEDAQLTPSQEYFGTPYYAAPEQLRSARAADARSDVWSLGAILFELLTGRTPFVGTPTSVVTKVVSDPVPWPTDLRPDLPPGLAQIVMRALRRSPHDRFQNMRAFALALEPFGPTRRHPQRRPEVHRNAWLAPLAIGLPMGAVIAIGLGALMQWRAPSRALVGAASTRPVPNAVLAAPPVSVARTPTLGSVPALGVTALPAPRAARAARTNSAAPPSRKPFNPSGI